MGNLHIRRSKSGKNGICSVVIKNIKTDRFQWIDPATQGIFFKLLSLEPGSNISAKDLAYHYGMSLDTIRKHLNRLKDIGFLKTSKIQDNNSYIRTHYYLQESLEEADLEDDYEPERNS